MCFNKVGVDFAGLVLINSGHTHRSTVTEAYFCIVVCFKVQAVDLESVSDLTTAAFMDTLRQFIARRGTPSMIWSDQRTNSVKAAGELKDLYKIYEWQEMKDSIVNFCA